jgi:uncharacterized coiled-coil DUF342 family protein
MQNFEIAQKIRDIREKISELRDEEEILHVKIRNKQSEVDSVRDRRDELNAKVKDLSKKPKEILAKRKEVWDNIEEMNEEKKKLYREMQPYLQRIGELRKIRDSYNQASRGTFERLLNTYNGTKDNLLKDDISLKNELYLYNFLFEIRDRLMVKARADAIHQEIVRIKEVDLKKYNEVMGEMEDNIGEMKSESHEGLMTAKEMWSKRDSIRDDAQKEHKAFIEGMNVVKSLKKERWKLKKEITALYREIDEWKKEFKKGPQERMRSDKDRRLQDALAKYKRGESLSLDELSLLVESGNIEG